MLAAAPWRGFFPTRLASCNATLVAKSPWSALRGRSSSIAHSPASGNALRTASAMRPVSRVFGSNAGAFREESKTPNYTGTPSSDLLRVHVEGPADAAVVPLRQGCLPFGQERLEGGARGRAPEELRS